MHEHEGLREWGAPAARCASTRERRGGAGGALLRRGPASADPLWSLPGYLRAGGRSCAGRQAAPRLCRYGLGAHTWGLGARLNLRTSFDVSEGTHSEDAVNAPQTLGLMGSLRY